MIDFNLLYAERRKKVVEFLKKNQIEAVVFEDSEERRDVAVRYLTGHPSDAVLIITLDGNSILAVWDENLAKDKAYANQILPYTKFNRSAITAVTQILTPYCSKKNPTVALSPFTAQYKYQKYKNSLTGWNIICKEDSVHNYVTCMRSVKDEYEIECTKKACAITDMITEAIIQGVKSGKIKTEIDVALYIEKELRIQGCEKTSFDTLAAGANRSFAIHAFPGYTNALWANNGLSILDYGVCFQGYASDCTITIAKGNLTKEQEELLELVQKAADECLKLYKPGISILSAAEKANSIFAEKNLSMPHGLGHGTGLEIHEEPFVSMRAKKEDVFKEGNIITLEPGLYSKELGGTRLENDVLITKTGNEVLTHSKIFRL